MMPHMISRIVQQERMSQGDGKIGGGWHKFSGNGRDDETGTCVWNYPEDL